MYASQYIQALDKHCDEQEELTHRGVSIGLFGSRPMLRL